MLTIFPSTIVTSIGSDPAAGLVTPAFRHLHADAYWYCRARCAHTRLRARCLSSAARRTSPGSRRRCIVSLTTHLPQRMDSADAASGRIDEAREQDYVIGAWRVSIASFASETGGGRHARGRRGFSSFATRPVQPVWWRRRRRGRCRRGSIRRTARSRGSADRSAAAGTAPNTGRRPRSSLRNSRSSRVRELVGDLLDRDAAGPSRSGTRP